MKELKSLIINTEQGVYSINGKDISDMAHAFTAEFNDGQWNVTVNQADRYNGSVQKIHNSKG